MQAADTCRGKVLCKPERPSLLEEPSSPTLGLVSVKTRWLIGPQQLCDLSRSGLEVVEPVHQQRACLWKTRLLSVSEEIEEEVSHLGDSPPLLPPCLSELLVFY